MPCSFSLHKIWILPSVTEAGDANLSLAIFFFSFCSHLWVCFQLVIVNVLEALN